MTQASTWDDYQKTKQVVLGIGEETKDFLAFVRALAYLLLTFPTLIAEVLMHRRFGARALNFFNAWVGATILGSLLAVFDITGGARLLMWGLLMTGYLGMLVYHLLSMKLNEWNGARWHSRTPGVPHAFWRRVPLGSNPLNV